MAINWNDVKVLNPNTGLYEAYIKRTREFNASQPYSCGAGTGWGQCAFIHNDNFQTGEIFANQTLSHGMFIGWTTPNGAHSCAEIIRVVTEQEFITGTFTCPAGWQEGWNGTTFQYDNCPCTVSYSELSGPVQYSPGVYTVNYSGYCCSECTSNIPCAGGCTDQLALNFDPTAVIDDGSCQYYGCTDILAANYNSQAVIDDGSCVYAGCTDPNASNYNANATIDDGSCVCTKCCENVDILGNVTHMTLNSTASPCVCPTGWYDVTCGEFLGWECSPGVGTCSLVLNGAYSSQTECDLECSECGCMKLLGTGHTDAYHVSLSADCEELCCDPDLNVCDILVIGNDEGIQQYNPVTNNTLHLFDDNYSDTTDIAATSSFIWTMKNTGGGATISEHAITLAPFTNTFIRSLNVPATSFGNGMTYYEHNSSGEVVLSVGGFGKVFNVTLPIGTTNTTPLYSIAYLLPVGYNVTGDLITTGPTTNPLDIVLYDNGTTYKVGLISRLTGVVLDEHTISSTILTGSTKFEALYIDQSSGVVASSFVAGITTDGRVYELQQNPLQFAPASTGQIDFINQVTNTVYGSDNIALNNEACGRDFIETPTTYNCVVSQGGCTDPGTGLGQYTLQTALSNGYTSALAECIGAGCVVSWNCNPGTVANNCNATNHPILGEYINQTWVENAPTALEFISIGWNGLQNKNFNYISWPLVNAPVSLPGICYIKWNFNPPTMEQKWKITGIELDIANTGIHQSWASFVQSLASWAPAFATTFNLSNSYQVIQNFIYNVFFFGQSTTIKIHSEPCICNGIPCSCEPILGTSGTFISEDECYNPPAASGYLPCCPCEKCCVNTWGNHISLAITTNPCKCPPGYFETPCDQHVQICMKTCMDGLYRIPLDENDEVCDCERLGLEEAPPLCEKCCTNGTLTKLLDLTDTACSCDDGWYECETTPICDVICVSSDDKTNRTVLRPEWPNCTCPSGFEVYGQEDDNLVDTQTGTTVTIKCSKCENNEALNNIFEGTSCPSGWSPTEDFNSESCISETTCCCLIDEETGKCKEGSQIQYDSACPVGYIVCVEDDTDSDSEVEDPDRPDSEEREDTDDRGTVIGYSCMKQTNALVSELQQTCTPIFDTDGVEARFETLSSCLTSGCGGWVTCAAEYEVNGVRFIENSYTTIGMCCESIINSYEGSLGTSICAELCGEAGRREIWYPLHNVFAVNNAVEGPFGYMLREVLNGINLSQCEVSQTDEWRLDGYDRI